MSFLAMISRDKKGNNELSSEYKSVSLSTDECDGRSPLAKENSEDVQTKDVILERNKVDRRPSELSSLGSPLLTQLARLENITPQHSQVLSPCRSVNVSPPTQMTAPRSCKKSSRSRRNKTSSVSNKHNGRTKNPTPHIRKSVIRDRDVRSSSIAVNEFLLDQKTSGRIPSTAPRSRRRRRGKHVQGRSTQHSPAQEGSETPTNDEVISNAPIFSKHATNVPKRESGSAPSGRPSSSFDSRMYLRQTNSFAHNEEVSGFPVNPVTFVNFASAPADPGSVPVSGSPENELKAPVDPGSKASASEVNSSATASVVLVDTQSFHIVREAQHKKAALKSDSYEYSKVSNPSKFLRDRVPPRNFETVKPSAELSPGRTISDDTDEHTQDDVDSPDGMGTNVAQTNDDLPVLSELTPTRALCRDERLPNIDSNKRNSPLEDACSQMDTDNAFASLLPSVTQNQKPLSSRTTASAKGGSSRPSSSPSSSPSPRAVGAKVHLGPNESQAMIKRRLEGHMRTLSGDGGTSMTKSVPVATSSFGPKVCHELPVQTSVQFSSESGNICGSKGLFKSTGIEEKITIVAKKQSVDPGAKSRFDEEIQENTCKGNLTKVPRNEGATDFLSIDDNLVCTNEQVQIISKVADKRDALAFSNSEQEQQHGAIFRNSGHVFEGCGEEISDLEGCLSGQPENDCTVASPTGPNSCVGVDISLSGSGNSALESKPDTNLTPKINSGHEQVNTARVSSFVRSSCIIPKKRADWRNLRRNFNVQNDENAARISMNSTTDLEVCEPVFGDLAVNSRALFRTSYSSSPLSKKSLISDGKNDRIDSNEIDTNTKPEAENQTSEDCNARGIFGNLPSPKFTKSSHVVNSGTDAKQIHQSVFARKAPLRTPILKGMSADKPDLATTEGGHDEEEKEFHETNDRDEAVSGRKSSVVRSERQIHFDIDMVRAKSPSPHHTGPVSNELGTVDHPSQHCDGTGAPADVDLQFVFSSQIGNRLTRAKKKGIPTRKVPLRSKSCEHLESNSNTPLAIGACQARDRFNGAGTFKTRGTECFPHHSPKENEAGPNMTREITEVEMNALRGIPSGTQHKGNTRKSFIGKAIFSDLNGKEGDATTAHPINNVINVPFRNFERRIPEGNCGLAMDDSSSKSGETASTDSVPEPRQSKKRIRDNDDDFVLKPTEALKLRRHSTQMFSGGTRYFGPITRAQARSSIGSNDRDDGVISIDEEEVPIFSDRNCETLANSGGEPAAVKSNRKLNVGGNFSKSADASVPPEQTFGQSNRSWHRDSIVLGISVFEQMEQDLQTLVCCQDDEVERLLQGLQAGFCLEYVADRKYVKPWHAPKPSRLASRIRAMKEVVQLRVWETFKEFAGSVSRAIADEATSTISLADVFVQAQPSSVLDGKLSKVSNFHTGGPQFDAVHVNHSNFDHWKTNTGVLTKVLPKRRCSKPLRHADSPDDSTGVDRKRDVFTYEEDEGAGQSGDDCLGRRDSSLCKEGKGAQTTKIKKIVAIAKNSDERLENENEEHRDNLGAGLQGPTINTQKGKSNDVAKGKDGDSFFRMHGVRRMTSVNMLKEYVGNDFNGLNLVCYRSRALLKLCDVPLGRTMEMLYEATPIGKARLGHLLKMLVQDNLLDETEHEKSTLFKTTKRVSKM